MGAVAAALASMVGELTVGKKRYADVEAQMVGALGRLALLRSRLVSLIDEDAEAFAPLARAYGLPKDTPQEAADKDSALQSALIGACEPPLAIMQACVDVLHECDFIARNGSRLALSDAGACAVLAKAAAIAASFNVYINADAMTDEARREAVRQKADELAADAGQRADDVYEYVAAQIGAPCASEGR